MSLINQIDTRSEQEVIQILKENGIRVVMKLVALLPDTLDSYHGIGRRSIGIIETDIYEALRKLEVRKKVIGDPFS